MPGPKDGNALQSDQQTEPLSISLPVVSNKQTTSIQDNTTTTATTTTTTTISPVTTPVITTLPPPPPPSSQPAAALPRRSGPTLSLATVTASGIAVSPSEEYNDPLSVARPDIGTSSGQLSGENSPAGSGYVTPGSPSSTNTSFSTTAGPLGMVAGSVVTRIQALAQRQQARLPREKGLAQRVEDLAASARENVAGWSARAQVAGSELGLAVGQWTRGLRKDESSYQENITPPATTTGTSAMHQLAPNREDTDATSIHSGNEEENIATTNGSEHKEGVIFGVPLEVAIAAQPIDVDWQVPAVLIRCTEFLDEHGLNEVGLYRIPGRWSAVTKLRQYFDRGLDMDLLDESATAPYFDDLIITANVVATLLKMYLRELPEPLFTHAFLPAFNALLPSAKTSNNDKSTVAPTSTTSSSCSSSSTTTASTSFNCYINGIGVETETEVTIEDELKAAHAMRVVADQLPMANRHVLHWAACHLRRLALRSERNKMTLSNLGLIFCPTLGVSSLLFRMIVTYVEIIVPVEHHDCDTNRHRRETASTREALQREKQQVADTATITATATHNANETDTNDKNIATAILVDLSYDDSTETNNPVSVSNTTSTFIPSVHSTSPPPLLPPRPKSRTASNASIDAVVSPSFPSPSPSSVQPSDCKLSSLASNTTTSTNTKSIPPPLPPRSRRASPPASLTLVSSSLSHHHHQHRPSTTSSGSGSGSEVNSIPSESISSSHQSYPTGLVQIPIDQMYCSRASATADDTDQVDLLSDDLAECGLLNLSPRLGVHPGRVARTRALFEH